MLSPSLPRHFPLSVLVGSPSACFADLDQDKADRAEMEERDSRRKLEVISMLIRILLPYSLAHRTPATSPPSVTTEDSLSTPPPLPEPFEASFWGTLDALASGRPKQCSPGDCIDPLLLQPVIMTAVTSPPTHGFMQSTMPALSASPESTPAPSLQKAGSTGSTGSNTASLPTPVTAHLPLSPISGNNTPKARMAALKDVSGQNMQIHMPPQDARGLASDLNQLKVQSPSAPDHAENAPIASPRSTRTNGHTTNGHARTYSSSTESSPSTGPAPPSQLGSVYGAEGFPNYPYDMIQSGESLVDPKLDEEALRAVMSADAAVMKLNGTSSVQSYPGYAPLPSNPYQLPRGYAGFVPNQRPDPQPLPSQHGASRQSSTSSSTTEDASTSSEESDLCVPTVEWVDIPKSGMPASTPFFHMPQGEHRGSFGQRERPNVAGRKSPGKMAPPTTTGRRRGSNGTNGVPSGLPPSRESALPGDLKPDAPVEEEDDEATVGHGGRRDRSPSGSSQSTGLDLLYAAAYTGQDPREQRGADNKGKRKAGAGPEAIAQWRTSGIPTGVRDVETLASVEKGAVPKKRRRSSVEDDDNNIDPSLRDQDDVSMDEAVDESSSPAPEDVDDEEYGARGRAKGAGRGRGGRRGGKARTSGASAGTPAKGAAAGGAAAGQGAGGKKAKKEDDYSPNGRGGSGARRASAGAPLAGGVQCEYVNPLPPFNRCTDIFTRKYDLPRHMARHARREGELVEEGKLAEDKALLWKTIKDKPKVECAQCGESFTRMDALKRHQTKQHHG